jgi:SAM-dependent MidA family methyltransferase
VEVDDAGDVRVVHVDPATGTESLGHRVRDAGVPPSIGGWLEAWWPLDGREPGTRAEVGTSRDQAWSDVVRRVTRGLAIAVDYGHTRRTRPAHGSLRSYRLGREVDVVPDGSRDVTAHVAVDAVAAAAEGVLLRQREVLPLLGVGAERPAPSLAGQDPVEYVAALSRANTAAELMGTGGFGDFYWIVSGAGGVVPGLGAG